MVKSCSLFLTCLCLRALSTKTYLVVAVSVSGGAPGHCEAMFGLDQSVLELNSGLRKVRQSIRLKMEFRD